MRHGLVSFAFKVPPARRPRLERLLDQWQPDGSAPDQLNLGALDGLHFASLTIFDRPFLDPLLVLECNFDGRLETFLEDFIRTCGAPLRELLSACEGTAPARDDSLAALLRDRAHLPLAGHVGTVGLSRREIVGSHRLVSEIRDFLSAGGSGLRTRPPGEIVAELTRLFGVRARELVHGERRTLVERAADLLALVGVALLTVPPLLVLLPLLRWREDREVTRSHAWPPDARRLEEVEDRRLPSGMPVAQNHLSSLVPIKTGAVRAATLRLFMALLWRAARVTQAKGSLGGIPSIHFAHWTAVDEGSGLLFFSNFDGSWGSYLDDFIEKAANGLTGVWSHGQGFPRSRWLIGGGAREGSAFKAYARDSQTSEAMWFSAYPVLATSQINGNRAIVEGLIRPPRDAAAWLRRF